MHGSLLKKLLVVCVLMFGFGYALVPLYSVFCRYTGLNGKTANSAAAEAKTLDQGRSLRVEFLANPDARVPWRFMPEVSAIEVHPGEKHLVHYRVENLSGKALVAQAIPSVAPGQAAQYFKKIECFCFTQQMLAKDETKNMPLVFYVDPALPENIQTLTLSYSLYEVAPVN